MDRCKRRRCRGSSKGGLPFAAGGCKECGENSLDRKSYLIIIRQAFLNPNPDETLLAKDQIECHGVKMFSRPRVFGGRQLVEARDQAGRVFKLGIYWDGSTRYLDIPPPNKADV